MFSIPQPPACSNRNPIPAVASQKAAKILDSLLNSNYIGKLFFNKSSKAGGSTRCRSETKVRVLTIEPNGIVIIVGNYGSGKTEVAINLAARGRELGQEVRIADLDLVNPYFRTREALAAMNRLDIDLVLPEKKYMSADLPILTPAVAGMIRKPASLTLLDAGGDDVGATVLAALADALDGRDYRMLQVINPYRPFTDSIDGCRRIGEEIMAASHLTIGGYIANPNLIDETTIDHVNDGYLFAEKLAQASGLPLAFLAVAGQLVPSLDPLRVNCPVLTINRQLVPPWKVAEDLSVQPSNPEV